MKLKSFFILGFCLLCFTVQGCKDIEPEFTGTLTPSNFQQAEIGISTPSSPSHDHAVNVNNNWLKEQNASNFQMLEASLESSVIREDVTEDPTNTFRAFHTCVEYCRILVEEISTGKIYELQAPSFIPTRPYANLFWESDEVLVFDQWSQPHHGVHYAINIKSEILLLASPFPDQLPTQDTPETDNE